MDAEETKPSTHPIARFLGKSTLLNNTIYAKALIGRRNTGGVLLPHERSLANEIAPKDTNKYRRAQWSTNPATNAVEVGALGAGAYYGGSKAKAFVYEKARQLAHKRLELPEKMDEFVAQVPTVQRAQVKQVFDKAFGPGGVLKPKNIARLKNVTGGDLAYAGAAAGLTAAIYTAGHRALYPNIARGKATKYDITPAEHVDNLLAKKAGIPLAAIDDAAVYATKIINNIENDPHSVKDIVKEKKKKVEAEIQKIEKLGSVDLQLAVNAILHHPKGQAAHEGLVKLKDKFIAHPVAQKAIAEAKDIDEYGKTFHSGFRRVAVNPKFQAFVPGANETFGVYGAMAAHTREMVRNPKYNKIVNTIVNGLPK
jgi:hypothetical protein